jgi:hypothetical protein
VRKVRVTMAEKKLDYQLVLEDVWAPGSVITEANPLAKVPCLVMDGGEAVFDSRVIVEYLDMLSPVGKLIPSSGRERIEVHTWEALADGLLDAAILARLEAMWPGRSAEQRAPPPAGEVGPGAAAIVRAPDIAAGRVENAASRTGAEQSGRLRHAVRNRRRQPAGHRFGGFDRPGFKIHGGKPLAGGGAGKQAAIGGAELHPVHRSRREAGQLQIHRGITHPSPLGPGRPGKDEQSDQDES